MMSALTGCANYGVKDKGDLWNFKPTSMWGVHEIKYAYDRAILLEDRGDYADAIEAHKRIEHFYKNYPSLVKRYSKKRYDLPKRFEMELKFASTYAGAGYMDHSARRMQTAIDLAWKRVSDKDHTTDNQAESIADNVVETGIRLVEIYAKNDRDDIEALIQYRLKGFSHYSSTTQLASQTTTTDSGKP